MHQARCDEVERQFNDQTSQPPFYLLLLISRRLALGGYVRASTLGFVDPKLLRLMILSQGSRNTQLERIGPSSNTKLLLYSKILRKH